MKKSKDQVYEYIQKVTFTDSSSNKGLQTIEIADALGMQRSNVSAILNELLKEKRLEKTSSRPVLYYIPNSNEIREKVEIYKKLVGFDGSLRKAVQLAKAAILYPGSSLNMQIVAKAGCGTTYFAGLIHQFAIERGVINEDAPYVKVNCAHFIKNMDVLNTILFGDGDSIVKSAFCRAQGGVLFIDSIELLNAIQESRIFHFLETGEIISPDGTQVADCSNCIFVIGAELDDKPETVFNLPITIELPKLEDRPMEEKYELVRRCFNEEAQNLNCAIEVTREVVTSLLLARYNHNVKEMMVEIKSACANAYVRVLDEPEETMRVVLNDFNENVRRVVMHFSTASKEREAAERLIGSANHLLFDTNANKETSFGLDTNSDVYGNIRNQYMELTNRGISSESIHQVINTYIDSLLMGYTHYNGSRPNVVNKEQLSKTVDSKIIILVTQFNESCIKELGREFSTNVFYGLCLHLNALISRNMVDHKKVTPEQIQTAIRDYPKEYSLSIKFSSMIEETLGVQLPIEEVVILTLFIAEQEVAGEKPVLLYCLHGASAAKALADTTNSLTYCDNAYGFDMDLSKDPHEAMDELKEYIISIDRGAGVFVIYDMGSFKTMLDIIAEQTHIKIRYINIPISMIGIEAARLCNRDPNVDMVYHNISAEMMENLNSFGREKLKKVIITLCRTSEGGAAELKKYIDCYSHLGMRVVALSVMNRQNLANEIVELKKTYDIHAIVGTFDPCMFGIPFIPITSIFENRNEDLDKVLMFEPIDRSKLDYDELYRLFDEQFAHISTADVKKILPGIVSDLGRLYNLDEDAKIGLFLHIAALLDQLAAGKTRTCNKEAENYVKLYPNDYQILSKELRKLEKKFKVIISDSEAGIIIMTLKKL